MNYWIILFVFTGISFIVGNENNMPGTLLAFIGTYPLLILGIMIVITSICSILLNKIMLNIKSVL